MLAPKRTKYRKAHKGRIHGLAKGGTTFNFGAYGLKASIPGGSRPARSRRRGARSPGTSAVSGRVWIRIFPDVPVSHKPAEVRMGSGKGSPEYWICRVKPGRIMFELDGVPAGSGARSVRVRGGEIADRYPLCCARRRGGRRMKAGDVRAKTEDELKGEIDALGKEIFNLRFQRANGQLENTARVRQVRRDIARIKTILGAAAPQGATEQS